MLAFSGFTQTPNFFNIGQNDLYGLSIYAIHQKKDLLYVATDKGLFKQQYTGFKRIEFRNNPTFSLFDIKEDTTGFLYCKSLSGNIYKLVNDSLELFHTHDKRKFTGDFYYFFDKKNDLIISSKNTYRVDKTGYEHNLTAQIIPSDKLQSFNSAYSHATANGELFISSSTHPDYAMTYSNGKLSIYGNKSLPVGGDLFLYSYDSTQFIIGQGGTWFSKTNGIYKDPKKSTERFYPLNNGNIIGLDLKSGARILGLSGDTLYQKKTIFDERFISFAYQNKQGILFLGTFGEGILVVPDINQQVIHIKKPITSITSNYDKNLIISTLEGEIFELNDSLTLLDYSDKTISAVFFSGIGVGTALQKKHQIIYETSNNALGALKDLVPLCNDFLLYSNQVSVHAVTNDYEKYKNVLKDFSPLSNNIDGANIYRYKIEDRYNAIEINPVTNNIYTSNGYNVVNISKNIELRYENAPIKANDLLFYKKDIIIATIQKGILFYKNNGVEKKLTLKDGLLSNTIYSIKRFDSLLFIHTARGFQVMNLNDYTFHNLNITHGIDNHKILDFEVIDSSLWIASKHKVYNISIPKLVKQEPLPHFSIDSVFINNKYTSKTVFKNYENKLQVFLSTHNIFTQLHGHYTYQLIGFEDSLKTIPAHEHIINYDFLPPGNYTLKVVLHGNNQNSEPVFYRFSIAPPYYQTWWFYVIIISIIVILALIFSRFLIRRIKKKNQERLEREVLSKNLLDSELKALRSQMNPHFIFNSLNSIQTLILKQETDKSYDYISIFAELVRSTLDYSEQEFIPISKELRFLKVYLDLEKLRFKDDFSYTIDYSLSQDIQVPSILIQPFIENSLKHGLLHKQGSKKLEISFELKDYLICTIKDNGVGRNNASKFKHYNHDNHSSFSMKAIGKRLDILSDRYQKRFNYEIIDLDKNGVSSGTIVHLKMPFKKQL